MKTIRFLVATDPSYYGYAATPQEAQEYATFAHQYLLGHGFEQAEIEFVDHYPKGDSDEQAALRKEVWAAYHGTSSPPAG